jgi:hypothetical protein
MEQQWQSWSQSEICRRNEITEIIHTSHNDSHCTKWMKQDQSLSSSSSNTREASQWFIRTVTLKYTACTRRTMYVNKMNALPQKINAQDNRYQHQILRNASNITICKCGHTTLAGSSLLHISSSHQVSISHRDRSSFTVMRQRQRHWLAEISQPLPSHIDTHRHHTHYQP